MLPTTKARGHIGAASISVIRDLGYLVAADRHSEGCLFSADSKHPTFMFAQLRRVDGLDAVACNWEAACSNSGGSGTELLPACIAVKTSPEHEAPDLSAVAVGQCSVVL